MKVTALQSVLPRAPVEWLEALVHCTEKWGINTPIRFAAFAGQLAHECDQFTRLEENLNYSAERLVAVWPKRFPTVADATPYAHSPEKLANKVYSGRMGNGDQASGDGWYFRGRGPIQITGFDNYNRTGKATGIDLIAHPEKLLIPAIGVATAGWYWQLTGCNQLADAGNNSAVTQAINGGTNGLKERADWQVKIYGAIK